MQKALFLDRDGVINYEIGYLHRAEDVRWMEGILPLCQTAQALGYKLVIVTNQSGIARNLYTEQDFHILMDWMRAELSRDNITLDAVYFSPHLDEHEDRKPNPGMLLRAARDLNLDLAESILIGDRCSDIAAANAAGLKQAFLLAGTEPNPCPGNALPINSLAEVQVWLTANPPL